MCGLAGWIAPRGLGVGELEAMTVAAAHRGPDGDGYWFRSPEAPAGRLTTTLAGHSQAATVALGHRRLAILDLSQAGAQPMGSADRRLWMVLNGEIYNYVELRRELCKAGHRFVSSTDTEVALAAYAEWGTGCFERFNGMWGLAIVDLRRQVLILSRDRFGIKPLYVAASSGALFFASEIKQLLASRWIKPVANSSAVVEYIDTGYQTEPLTMFAGIEAHEPGCWSETPLDRPARPSPQSFWQPPPTQRSTPDLRATAVEFRELFDDAIRLQLRADVPVGVCLSGGLDSSAVYGQARRCGGNAVDAFSAAFDDKAFDERPFINQVLAQHGGRGHLTFPTADDFIRDCDRFVYHHDEPVGSMSQYAAWSVMALTRQAHVPVVMLGQGADELFSGYWSAYYMFLRQRPSMLPSHLIGSLLPGGNASLVTQIIPHLRQYYSRRFRKNRGILRDRWRALHGTRPDNWAFRAQQLDPAAYRLAEIREIHLPRLLRWDDRNTMAFGVEGRYPFLDHRLVELALSIPPRLNFHHGWNKYVMRMALGDLLPPTIQWRRSKNGFVTPQSQWLSTTLRPVLRDWAARPSERLSEIVDVTALGRLAHELFRGNLRPMDERQLLFVRLFLLDRWLTRFDVTVPAAPEAPSTGVIAPAASLCGVIQAVGSSAAF
jgi:asparagine synthase (glutamine-hydrolysing)